MKTEEICMKMQKQLVRRLQALDEENEQNIEKLKAGVDGEVMSGDWGGLAESADMIGYNLSRAAKIKKLIEEIDSFTDADFEEMKETYQWEIVGRAAQIALTSSLVDFESFIEYRKCRK